MKNTGMTRPVNSNGRVSIPRELLYVKGIDIGDPVEIFIYEGSLHIRKYKPGCVFCRNTHEVAKYKGKAICDECLKEFRGR